MKSTTSKIIGDYMRDARPKLKGVYDSSKNPQGGLYPKVWTLVNHTNKTIRFFLNDGTPLTQNGSYMSLEYFTHHYKKDMMLQDYSYLNYPSTL